MDLFLDIPKPLTGLDTQVLLPPLPVLPTNVADIALTSEPKQSSSESNIIVYLGTNDNGAYGIDVSAPEGQQRAYGFEHMSLH